MNKKLCQFPCNIFLQLFLLGFLVSENFLPIIFRSCTFSTEFCICNILIFSWNIPQRCLFSQNSFGKISLNFAELFFQICRNLHELRQRCFPLKCLQNKWKIAWKCSENESSIFVDETPSRGTVSLQTERFDRWKICEFAQTSRLSHLLLTFNQDWSKQRWGFTYHGNSRKIGYKKLEGHK